MPIIANRSRNVFMIGDANTFLSTYTGSRKCSQRSNHASMMGGGSDLGTSFSFRGKLVNASNDPFQSGVEYGAGAVLVGHKYLMFGGYNRSVGKHRVYIFDRVTNEWSTVLPQNVHNRFGSIRMTFIEGDVLYACTWYGRNRKHVFMALDMLSMEEWVPAGVNVCPNTGFGTSGSYIEARNEGVLFGGEKCGTEIFVYSVERSSWYSPKVTGTPPAPRRDHATCSIGLQMFVLGGRQVGGRNFGSLDLHVLSMEGARFLWSTPVSSGQAPRARNLFPALCVSGRIFVYGGYGVYDVARCFEVYSLKENRWYNGTSDVTTEQEGIVHFMSDLEEVNANCTALVADDKLIVLGGNRLQPKTPLEITPYEAHNV